ncbi:MAG: Rv1355c family protein [Bacteroidota bacterium]|nr:Rv1355c family protein [Bacteroidota bacterium]MDP3145911.1 Rv1355c family protein [Bacteroidota bacterium]
MMKTKLDTINHRNKALDTIFLPQFFRLSNNSDKQKLDVLLEANSDVKVFDQIYNQIEELVKVKNPSIKFSAANLSEAVKKQIGLIPIEEYGVWVYYPWSNRLVHILDEEEFVNVRTSRNQNKITREERAILEQKKIGIIGLSVGQSVSVTLAMERVCGEIRLADFDLLELTNLNRIRTGVHNLGLAKVYSVAREIAEIDPFLKVICFPQGLIDSNMDEFFLGGGKLDLLIEESDGFDIKILSRYKARELKIPVVMEASDRCTVDVERFDLEPKRSILHGLVDHLDIETLKKLKTTEEKIPYMLDMLGIETSSLRLKASMLEIEQTINTWPQLASAVTMGGGIATDVSRRLLLNQFTESGRYHVDIEELIGNKKNEENELLEISNNENFKASLSQNEMQTIAGKLIIEINETLITPTHQQINTLVEAAIKAPSGGNAQAWTWYYSKGNLFLFHDVNRSYSLLDFDNLASYISFGAATENLILKANQIGLNPNSIPFPLKTDLRVVCQFVFTKEQSNSNQKEYNYLVEEIDARLTNRTISDRQLINPDLLLQLQQVASSIDGAQMKVIDSIADIEKLAHVISNVERLRMMNQRGHSDFVKEIRWTDEEHELKRDGVDLKTVDITAAEKAGLIVAKNWNVIKLLKKWRKGTAFEKLAKKTVLSSSAMCLITMPEYSPISYFNGGRSVQRTWLAANKLNISFQPQSPATFLFARLIKGNGVGIDEDCKNELNLLRNQFLKIMNTESHRCDVFLFRLCIANLPEKKSLRRKIDDVLINE